ncbi:MAG TPA: 2-oxoglutarate dehydrogenase E1 component [Chloroflexota bacterium]|nr:2-oxoglutarate dehydrogenase E1 component [Chloroflexota bacterium]
MSDRDSRRAFVGPNAGYVLELFDQYRQDPGRLDPATREFFATWTPPAEWTHQLGEPRLGIKKPDAELPAIERIIGLNALAQAIRGFGHLCASLDPLGSVPPGDPALDPATHGLSQPDIAEMPATIVGGPVADRESNALAAVTELRRLYSDTTGYQFDHISSANERRWLRQAVETCQFRPPTAAVDETELLERLTEVEVFERFLHQAYPGQKRFSIEGTDMLIPVLDEVIRHAAANGTRAIMLGMAHRGRLNVLAHILGKPYSAILKEFQGPDSRAREAPTDSTDDGFTGDVKYHLGARRNVTDGTDVGVQVTLAPNPSHLEFVNPVVEGMCRAADEDRTRGGPPVQDETRSLAILVHGDAAFPGQGIVAETLNFSRLPGYRTGGTIHVIANNQLGYTAEPDETRSALYASDLAKGFEIPIVHVNADDPVACIGAARLALAYRNEFHQDFLIDLIGYRRWGHNEADEPRFTQPGMYERIARHPTVLDIWAGELTRRGVVSEQESQEMVETVKRRLEAARARGLTTKEVLPSPRVARRTTSNNDIQTSQRADDLIALNEAIHTLPDAFMPHPRLGPLLDRRRRAPGSGDAIDWAHAESLALASILADGVPIRFTGQDVERGTFSQRHLVLHDSATGNRLTPHQHLPGVRASFEIRNSPLSEAAALGFEYGYSVEAPDAMVIWEAQFGDFVNAAQVILDQFIVSGYSKWGQRSGLVLLLPHGYEGQGPEHSSGRLERFLQLAAQDNVRVANCTTAGQFFHLLRLQAAHLRLNPRPLIVMSPKSLLRHPMAASTLSDLTEGTFQPVIDDQAARRLATSIRRVVVCSGKIYVELAAYFREHPDDSIAIVRIEQLYPFPTQEVRRTLAGYRNAAEIVWVQEEPRNMGAWQFVESRLRACLPPGGELSYVGRAERASPAEGSARQHAAKQAYIIRAALKGIGGELTGEKRQRHVA